MKKERLVIFSLLLTVLLLSMPSLINTSKIQFLQSVRAYKDALTWGCLVNSTGAYDWDEYVAEVDTCARINYYFFYDCEYYCFNTYWSQTTASNVAWALYWQSTGEYGDGVSNWWVGDFHPSNDYPYPPPWGHNWCDGYAGQDISDNEVYYYTTANGQQASIEYFTFMWTCSNGGTYWNDEQGYDSVPGITLPVIPVVDPNEDPPNYIPDNTNNHYGYIFGPQYGEVGMPFAWTGRTDLSLDGFSNPDYTNYCYIGFEGPSPQLKNPLPGSLSYRTGQQFAYDFWYASTYYRQSVHNALNYASWFAYYDTLDNTPLMQGWWNIQKPTNDPGNGYWWYSSLRVFGDSFYVCAG